MGGREGGLWVGKKNLKKITKKKCGQGRGLWVGGEGREGCG